MVWSRFLFYIRYLNQPKLDMKIKFTYLILLLLTVFFHNGLLAQTGANDLTFNPSDTGYNNGADGEIRSVLALPDGKIIIAGWFNHYTGIDRSKIARINADETLDTSFNPGTGANNMIEVLLRQPDGKIIIGGRFSEFNGVSRNGIARLNADGTLDESFNPGTGTDGIVYALAVQADGKILVGGEFTLFNGLTATKLMRLNADGTIDNSFAVSVGNGSVNGIAVQSNGKIIAVGSFYEFNGEIKGSLIRLNMDGSTDTSFITGMGANMPILTVALNSTGKIFIGGRFTSFKGQSKTGIVGLNEDGSINTAFNVGGGINGSVNSIVVQPDDKVLLAGFIMSYKGSESSKSIVRIKSNGDRDSSFTSLGADYEIRSITLKPDGKIVIVGPFMEFNNRTENFIACLNADSSRDINFNIGPGTGADNIINIIKKAPNDKMVIVGAFNNYNGVPRRNIARIDADGTLDTTFNPGDSVDGAIYALEVLSDGKILIGGYFTTYKGQPVNKLIRINPNGSLDTTFELNVPYHEFALQINDIEVLPDGKMLLIGRFNSPGSMDIYGVCRINSDGSYDAGFNNSNLKRNVFKIILQPDNKILLAAGGSYDSTIAANPVMRLNNDGSIDDSFSVVSSDYITTCHDIALQSDGKIIIVGQKLDQEGGLSVKKMARLNADGTFDSSFIQPNLNSVPKIELQPDGKIIAANIYKFNDENIKGLARINQDGTLDTTFNCGEGLYFGTVRSILFQQSGKMIITGGFVAYNGVGRNRIARITTSGAMSVETFATKANNVIVYRDNNALQVNSSDKEIQNVMVYDLSGRLVAENRNVKAASVSLNNSVAVNTILIVKVKMTDGTQSVKKIYY